MICPFCTSKTRIYNSRSTQQATQTWRRHRCMSCKKSFTTRERIDWDGVVLVQSEGPESPYSRERLLLSLIRASQNLELGPGTISDLCDATEHQLQKNNFFNARRQNSELITATTVQVLQRFDTNLAVQYINCVYRSKPPIELLKQLTDI